MTTITRAATAAAICAAVLLTGTACTSDDDGPKTSAKKSAPATPTATAVAEAVPDLYPDTVTKAPEIERKTIASFANGQFGRAIPFKGGLHKGTLGIALNCEGQGTVTVEVPDIGMTFVEECADGKVATIYNETEISSADPDAYVHVMGTSEVRWSVSAGQ
ncbi:hypothetical protein ACOT81_19040 [Streptomyces sp. WI04-05B]|uniref:hypothetical protein n=1 Tax=Streptomyces TaxID=1883 RepID=UPI0029B647F1|nr:MULTISPECIES: hypothetical protein [unclassified Streptomyces]MDX2542520.1 hypothetical protein [Streptomyces sp. WI04-05B]MDX2582461.1 hypothetical protein [Streptomyces sp. WI04-05A]